MAAPLIDPEGAFDFRDTPRTVTKRGTSNGNSSGNAEDRRRRRAWLLETYAADKVLVLVGGHDRLRDIPRTAIPIYEASGDTIVEACRCYRCGKLLTLETLTVDRIIPGCLGGTYRRNNIRPACKDCNEHTGGKLAHRT